MANRRRRNTEAFGGPCKTAFFCDSEKHGQRAEVTVDAFPGRHFTGHVDSLSGGTGARFSLLPPDNASGNFTKVVQRVPVKIVLDPIPQEKAVLRPGMNVVATVISK